MPIATARLPGMLAVKKCKAKRGVEKVVTTVSKKDVHHSESVEVSPVFTAREILR
jgi:hypothetical protein